MGYIEENNMKNIEDNSAIIELVVYRLRTVKILKSNLSDF